MFPWIGEQSYIEMLFRQFSNLTTYVSVFGKLLYQHFNLSLFSNPGVKVLILVESMVQICPLVFFLLSAFYNDILKCWSNNFPTTLTCVVNLENCQNNTSMYGCSPIQGKRVKFLFKFYEARISKSNICITFFFQSGSRQSYYSYLDQKVPFYVQLT